jgi:hypothetical protein
VAPENAHFTRKTERPNIRNVCRFARKCGDDDETFFPCFLDLIILTELSPLYDSNVLGHMNMFWIQTAGSADVRIK